MRFSRAWVSLVASLASFATGTVTTTTDEVTVDGERGSEPTQRLESTGYAASGVSFYVWDEDARQGRAWAAELARGEHASAREDSARSRT